MKDECRRLHLGLLLAAAVAALSGCQPVEANILSDKDLSLVWSDEFDGTAVDESRWIFETGGGGWGNNEQQYYRKENSEIRNIPGEEGKALVITAKAESYLSYKYTSSRLKTQGKHSWKYGRIEARLKLPEGQGIWPAFWMLGDSIATEKWPRCGEIDIMEMVGGANGKDRTIHGTLHWYTNDWIHMGGSKTFSQNLSTDFRVYGIEWDSTEIRWYVDGQLFHSQRITADTMTEFHKPFFLLLNLAVGGNWPGSPDTTTVFPQEYWIDWVRVYQ